MKRLKKILVPTDLSEHSRRALSYGCWLAAEEQSSLVILHVADELVAWELYSEDLVFLHGNAKRWPIDRVLAEANLDLNRFLEPCLPDLKNAASASKRVILGSVPERIVAVAEEEKADLIIMSPQRRRRLRHLFFGGVTDRVTRLSPCPVLSLSPPLPSRQWRGKSVSLFFPWSRRRTVEV
jgi:nucleotide-binding universal stress UspA family protein